MYGHFSTYICEHYLCEKSHDDLIGRLFFTLEDYVDPPTLKQQLLIGYELVKDRRDTGHGVFDQFD